MKNFKITKFGESQSSGAFAVSKLRQSFDEVIGDGSHYSEDLGNGCALEMGGKDSRTGLCLSVVVCGGDPKMALYLDPSNVVCGHVEGYSVISNDGNLLLLDFDKQEAASLYLGFSVTDIQGIERVGNSIKVTVIGKVGNSEYDEQIVIHYNAGSLLCTGVELNELEKEDESFGSDDSSDDEY